jgi:hypothetical protein
LKTALLLLRISEYVDWGVHFDEFTTKDVTVEWADKTRAGQIGMILVTFAKISIVSFLESLVDDLPQGHGLLKELLPVLRAFATYDSFRAKFCPEKENPKSGKGDGPEGVGKEECSGASSEEKDPLLVWQSQCSKVGVLLLSVLFDMFGGEYDDVISNVLGSHRGSVIQINWMSQELMSDKAFTLGEQIKAISKMLTVSSGAISIDGDQAPKMTNRGLKRGLSVGDVDEDVDMGPAGSEGAAAAAERAALKKERADTWTKAQGQRRKFLKVVHNSSKTAVGMQAFFAQLGYIYKHSATENAKPMEETRVFLLSTDTMIPCQGEPADAWYCPGQASKADKDWITEKLEFLGKQNGPSDVVACFDGRSKETRQLMEPTLENFRNVSEVWLVYKVASQLSYGRKVAYASPNREVAWVSLPTPRTKVAAKDRESGACEETTTHASTWTGINPVALSALPHITEQNKKEIMKTISTTPKWFGENGGVPLCLQEKKPLEWWISFLKALGAKTVVDLTPGAGTVGRACLALGIVCLSWCGSESHAKWLTNVYDRFALEQIIKTQSSLYEPELAKLVESHFQEMVEQLKEKDGLQDEFDEEALLAEFAAAGF